MKTTLLIFSFIQLLSFSVQAATKEELQAFCKEVIPHQEKLSFRSQMGILKEYLGAILNPDKLALPTTHEVKISKGNIIGGSKKGLRNVIFYAGATPETKENMALEEANKRYKKIEDALKIQYKLIRKMIAAGNEQACVERGEKIGFNPKDVMDLYVQKSSLRFETQLLTQTSAETALEKALNKLSGDWEVRTFMSGQSLIEELSSPDVGNIVIIAHATPEGIILDSNYNKIHMEVFRTVSPSIFSISLFSCHEEAVRKFYKPLEKIKTDSVHDKRLLFTPKMSAILGNPDTAPMNAFPGFMKEVEKVISENQNTSDDDAYPVKENKTCSLEFYGTEEKVGESSYSIKAIPFEVTEGAYSFSLNGNPIGVLDPQSHEPIFEFSCKFLRPGKSNVLINLDMNPFNKSKVFGSNFSAVLRISGEETITLAGVQTLRDDGSYRSTKFLFDLP